MAVKSVIYLGLTLAAMISGVSGLAQVSSGGEGAADRAIEKHHYTLLRIPKRETWIALVDSVYADTLILEDKSTLRFSSASILIAEHAFVGEKCLITSAGADGRGPGGSGEAGQNLSLVIVFHEVGSLTIDTRGGSGQKGSPGASGANGVSYQERGKPGSDGGHGGKGGSLRLFYSTVGFQPSFNGQGNGSISLLYTGGRSGVGGEGGVGGKPIKTDGTGRQLVCGTCPAAPSGPRGNPGTPGQDGALTLERIPD